MRRRVGDFVIWWPSRPLLLHTTKPIDSASTRWSNRSQVLDALVNTLNKVVEQYAPLAWS